MRKATAVPGGAQRSTGTSPLRSGPIRALRASLVFLFAFAGEQVQAQAANLVPTGFASAGSDAAPPTMRFLRQPLHWFLSDTLAARADESDVAPTAPGEPSATTPRRDPLRLGALSVSRKGVTPMGKTIGIGLEGGSPTAITARYAWSASEGVVVGAGSMAGPYWNTPTLSLHADYVWHPSVLLRTPAVDLSWFIGGGAAVVIGERLRSIVPIITPWVPVAYGAFGARFPIGVSLALQSLPIELYLQGNPSFFVFPGLSVWMGGAAGFRFYL